MLWNEATAIKAKRIISAEHDWYLSSQRYDAYFGFTTATTSSLKHSEQK